MKVLQLEAHLLRVLDAALGGQLGDALVEVVRAGGEPELAGLRHQLGAGSPSSWSLAVRGGACERTFPIDPADRMALAVVVHLHVADLVDEVRRDVALNFKSEELGDGLDGLVPWPRSKSGGGPS